ncbi:MAG: septum formation initiator family protein [Pseudohongiellaceae bacterium]
MKVLYGFLIIVFLIFQFQLWLGEDSVRALNMLQTELDAQRQINAELEERNRLLEIEVVELKTGHEAVEERARSELGMIEEGETFYLLLD